MCMLEISVKGEMLVDCLSHLQVGLMRGTGK